MPFPTFLHQIQFQILIEYYDSNDIKENLIISVDDNDLGSRQRNSPLMPASIETPELVEHMVNTVLKSPVAIF